MRLTLRTLLAYLDDTLEPSEIKEIGQKVAESDAAQELIARIRQVTRKRRLTTPPLTGPNAKFDPNVIAEYLDNELSGDQVAEIERICLESEVHLAEIAACHQILTLVLGEPALVPPTAKERMYGLVKGREAIPFRKAAPKAIANHAGRFEEEDTSVLGMPVSRRQAAWLKWAIPIAAVLLIAALGVAVYSVLPDGNPDKDKVVNADNVKFEKAEAPKDSSAKKPADKKPQEQPVVPPQPEKAVDTKVAEKPSDSRPPEKPADNKPPDNPVNQGPVEPSKERVAIGIYQGAPRQGNPSILVSRPREQETWTRVAPNSPVFSTDSLVSLPGYASEIRSAKGVRLSLWGTLPELNLTNRFCPDMYESAVTLHANPNVDLDFTLDSGRVYVANYKETPSLVRVRFLKQIWDVELKEHDSEVVIEIIKHYLTDVNYQDGDEPIADLTFYVLKGKAGLKYNYQEFPNLQGPTGPSLFVWNSKGGPPTDRTP